MAFNPLGSAQVPLSVFGGLVTEMAPPDLPEGVSPDCQDVIFAPGNVQSRPGFQRIFGTPFASSITGAKSFIDPDPLDAEGTLQNLYLDAGGNLWAENVVASAGTVTLIGSGLTPNSYMKAITAFGREYLAISDGLHGSDVPLQWDGQNLDRVTQDAPGAAPSISNLIIPKQNMALVGGFSMLRGSPNPPNTVEVYTAAPHGLQVGYQVLIAGVPASPINFISTLVIDNAAAPGIATVTVSAPHGLVPGSFAILRDINPAVVGTAIGAIVANNGVVTVSTTAVHGLEIGGWVQIAGVSNATYNGAWQVTQILNDLQFTYALNGPNTVASSSGGTVAIIWPVASTESAPQYFEVLAVPSATSFQVAISYSSGTWTTGSVFFAWDGTFYVTAIINPTTFHYQQYGPDATTTTIGTVTPHGQAAPGKHQMQVLFLTRNGAITAPSPSIEFIANGGQYLQVSNIPIGPPDVVARILAFTGALGAEFFYLSVAAEVNGQIVSTSTQVQDNTSSSVVLDFADNSLFAGIGISIPGNSPADQIVLDGALGFGYFASRLITWGQRNRIQNLRSMSFDGGYLSGGTTPLGWDASANVGGVLAPGHFGTGWQITLAASSVQGKLSQSLYADYLGDPIAEPNTLYKFRAWFQLAAFASDVTFTATISSVSTGFTSSVHIPLPQTTGMWIELVFPSSTPGTIPPDLLLTISASAVTFTGHIIVDEMSLIFAENPYTDTVMNFSYGDNPEAFDGITGALASTEDTQKVMGVAEVRETLYFLTQDPNGRLHETTDNGTTEPAGWAVRQIGTNCGLISTFALTSSQADSATASGGEQWFAWASWTGARIFGGSEAWKISQEIEPDWRGAGDAGAQQWSQATGINPAALVTAWALNDPAARVIYFGLPM